MQTPISLTRRPRQRGAAIVIFSLLAVTVILPMVGLAIDGGILYILQAKLSQACDAAALAGGRNLNNGNNTAAQTANAEATMAAFFNANFPSGTWKVRGFIPVRLPSTSRFRRPSTSCASSVLTMERLAPMARPHERT
jgi:Flp pilus assembly protein TadG